MSVISEIESDKLSYFYFIYFCILFISISFLREEQTNEWIISMRVNVAWK